MGEKPQLWSFDYPSWGSGTTKYVYARFDDGRIVFTGIEPNGTSSINAAEEIVLAIAGLGRIDPLTFRWFDLQTNLMYDRQDNEPGEFQFDELTVQFHQRVEVPDDVEIIGNEDRYEISDWNHFECPPEVIELFAEFIGPNPFQQKHAFDHRPGSLAWLRQTVDDLASKAHEN